MDRTEEKKKALHSYLMAKGVTARLSEDASGYRGELQRMMEEDGDNELRGDDGGRAFYKGGSAIYLSDDPAALAKVLTKDVAVELLSGLKLTKAKVNLLQSISKKDVSKVLTEVPNRTFTVDSPRTKKEKEMISAAIEAQAEEEREQLRERIERFWNRVNRK